MRPGRLRKGSPYTAPRKTLVEAKRLQRSNQVWFIFGRLDQKLFAPIITYILSQKRALSLYGPLQAMLERATSTPVSYGLSPSPLYLVLLRFRARGFLMLSRYSWFTGSLVLFSNGPPTEH